jgi:hypothetical protein
MDAAPGMADIQEIQSPIPYEPAKTFLKLLEKQGISKKLKKRGSVGS